MKRKKLRIPDRVWFVRAYRMEALSSKWAAGSFAEWYGDVFVEGPYKVTKIK